MAKIDYEISLDRFEILKQSDSSPDEPYFWPVSAKVDSNVSPFNPNAKVTIHLPSGSHGNMGAAFNAVRARQSKPLPRRADFTVFSGTLDTSLLAIAPQFEHRAGLSIALLCMEENGSSDADAEQIRISVRKALQEEADKVLAELISGQANVDLGTVIDRLIGAGTDGAASAVRHILTEDILNVVLFGPFSFFLLPQLIDPDKPVGVVNIGPITYSRLVGLGPQSLTFQKTTEPLQKFPTDARHRFGCSWRRRGFADWAQIAACRRPDGGAVVAKRESGSVFQTTFSRSPRGDYGIFKTVKNASDNAAETGVFLTGPSMSCSANGQVIHYCGLGMDQRVWHCRSRDGGATFELNWSPIGLGTFLSAPSVATFGDGSIVHVMGLGMDRRIWRAWSRDMGQSWEAAWLIVDPDQAAMQFHSAPALAASADGKILHLMCVDANGRIRRTRSADGGASWTWPWAGFGTSETIRSAPAVATSADGNIVRVFGRDADDRLRLWASDHGGRPNSQWAVLNAVADSQDSRARIISTPAVAMSPNGTEVHLFGITRQLQIGEMFSSNGGVDGWSEWRIVRDGSVTAW